MNNRTKEAGLTVNREKSVFGKTEVKYLGVLVNRDGFRPDPDKIEPMINFPVPKNLKQLRRFMGMASWYRKFLKGFATIAEPLMALTKRIGGMNGETHSKKPSRKLKHSCHRPPFWPDPLSMLSSSCKRMRATPSLTQCCYK